MRGQPLPDDDHAVRYCKRSTIDEDGFIGHGAFMLRDNPREEYLSANWLEKLPGGDEAERIAELCRIHLLERKPRDRFALLRVGDTVEAVRARSEADKLLRVLREPADEDRDYSHAGIHGTDGPDEEDTAQLLADAICRTYSAS